MLLRKYNRADQQFDAGYDEIIERFQNSSHAKDKRRELKVRLALFIASKEGYESTITSYKELVELVRKYKAFIKSTSQNSQVLAGCGFGKNVKSSTNNKSHSKKFKNKIVRKKGV